MKLPTYKAVLLGIALLGGLAGCQREEYGTGQDDGYVQLNLTHDPQAIVVSKADAQQVVYGVQFVNSKGNVAQNFPDHTQMPAQVKLKADTYTIRVSSGTEQDAAFDAPYYAGETSIKVRSGQNNEASVTCTLANTKVSVSYSDVIRENFTEYAVTISNGEEGSLIFGETETRPGYFRTTGSLRWTISLVNKNGTPYQMTQTISDVQPRQHYILRFDVNENSNPTDGGITSEIVIDPTTNEHSHEIGIVLNKKSKPQISGTGFDIASPVQIALGQPVDCEVALFAEAKISNVNLSHNSAHLSSVGIPASFSPIDADAAVKAAVNGEGITWSEPLSGAQSGRISFSALAAKLPLGTYELKIAVLDEQNQLVEQGLELVVIPDMKVSTLNTADVWAKFATLKGKWNTLERPAAIGLCYKKQSDAQWTTLAEGQLTVTGSEFSAQVTGLEPATDYQVKAVCEGESEANVVTFRTDAADLLPNMNLDEWSNDNTPGGKWSSGNNTFVKMTKKETSVVRNGNAVRMTSAEAMSIFAAGNLFTGSFGSIIMSPSMGAKLNFGTPYTCRPTTFSGYYNYSPETVSKYAKAPYTTDGQADFCHIYVMLTDWNSPFEVNTVDKKFISLDDPGIIAYGEFASDRKTEGYEPFRIDIEYRDSRTPKHIIVVATSSRYGDYFSGAVGSVLYVDELTFGFDAPVTWKK